MKKKKQDNNQNKMGAKQSHHDSTPQREAPWKETLGTFFYIIFYSQSFKEYLRAKTDPCMAINGQCFFFFSPEM